MKYELSHYKLLFEVVQNMLSHHIDDELPINKLFDELLIGLLKLTESKLAYIGEVIPNDTEVPLFNIYSSINSSFEKPISDDQVIESNLLANNEPYNFFEVILASEDEVVFNYTYESRNKEDGECKKFLGVKLFSHGELIGVLILINSVKKFSDEDVSFLQSVVSASSTIISSNREKNKYSLIEKRVNLLYEIINQSGEGVQVSSESGEFVFLNNSSLDRLESTLEEMLAKKVIDIESNFKTDEDWAQHVEELKVAKRIILDGVHETTSGVKIPVEVCVSYILVNGEGYICAIIKDITERRTREKQLVEAKEKAELANKTRQDFLSVMSHEIRTPLNAVIGLAHILSLNAENEDSVNKFESLLFSAESLLCLLNDVLDFNKMQSGNLKLESIPFSLPHLVKELITLHKTLADDKGVLLTSDTPALIEPVIGDKVRLTQVLSNLLNNAVKFTESGSIHLSVKILEKDVNKIKLRFEVKDTGIGIPSDKISSIFDVFTQVSSSTTRLFGGTGLGLSICKQLIEIQGGEIGVLSSYGLGTTFHFELEYKKHRSVDCSLKDNIDEKWEEIRLELESKHVLIVEDNQFNHMVVEGFLTRWNIKSTWAKNGIECLEVLKNLSFDLILMDLQMPLLDGYETSKIIRNLDSKKNKTPIIALTADTIGNVKEKALASGLDSFLTKPFKPQHLKSCLVQYLLDIER
jgi:PAS domain S-box-containing protein